MKILSSLATNLKKIIAFPDPPWKKTGPFSPYSLNLEDVSKLSKVIKKDGTGSISQSLTRQETDKPVIIEGESEFFIPDNPMT